MTAAPEVPNAATAGMRILHFNAKGTLTGGVELYIAGVARALAQAGVSSHLVHFGADDGPPILPAATTVPLGAEESPRADTFDLLEDVLARFRPDVAYIHAVYQPGIVDWLCRRLPCVGYVHGPYLVCPGNALYLRRSRRTCNRRAGPLCLLYAQREHCCFGRSPLRHVRRLADTRRFVAAHQRILTLVASSYMTAALQRAGIPPDRIRLLPPILFDGVGPAYRPPADSRTLLFAGRIAPEKGLHCLIEALAPIEGSWQLLVAGDGPDRAYCRELAGRLRVGDRISFLGWQSADEMERLYQACSFVVVPSLWPEPFGRVGPEALRHGRPVVAFDVGGISDWLQDGRTGYLVPAGDIRALGDALRHVLSSSLAGLRECGEFARSIAEDTWSARRHVASLMGYLNEAIRCYQPDSGRA